MRGFALTRTLADESFDTMALALDGLPDLFLFKLDPYNALPVSSGMSGSVGFLFVLTNRFCVSLYWSQETQDTFKMYDGGWTFHPGDVRTITTHLINHLDENYPETERLKQLLEETEIDRRYDDKLNILLTSLVNSLENRNRDVTMALEKVNDLSKRMVETERFAAIGQLCSVIAHEIRNPLGLIDLYAKLIEEQLKQLGVRPLTLEGEPSTLEPGLIQVNPEKQELLMKNLSFIRQATGNLETILTELTDYSRPLQLQLEPVDITQLVSDVCQFYEPYYQEKSVRLEFLVMVSDPNALPLMLMIDSGRVRQAIINLLKNALEASPTETVVKVTVACRKSDKYVYIKVSDQGRGVSAQVAKKLFTPYFSTKGNGTGLGLAHSRKILQAHGGNVELLSLPLPEETVKSEKPTKKAKASSSAGSIFAIILPRTPS
jgi:signal transduction histidine kinase